MASRPATAPSDPEGRWRSSCPGRRFRRVGRSRCPDSGWGFNSRGRPQRWVIGASVGSGSDRVPLSVLHGTVSSKLRSSGATTVLVAATRASLHDRSSKTASSIAGTSGPRMPRTWVCRRPRCARPRAAENLRARHACRIGGTARAQVWAVKQLRAEGRAVYLHCVRPHNRIPAPAVLSGHRERPRRLAGALSRPWMACVPTTNGDHF